MLIDEVLECVYLDVRIGESNVGRIVVELFKSKAPQTVEAFFLLLPKISNVPFEAVVKNFMVQTAGIEYEDTIQKENTDVDFEAPFYVCKANGAGFPFFITTFPAPHLKGQNTVFGRVCRGKSVVRTIEQVRTENGAPLHEVPVIYDSGVWNTGDSVPLYNASNDPIGGDTYEEYPEDAAFEKTSQSVFDAASTIKESGSALLKSGDAQSALFKYRKALRYAMEYFPDVDQEPQLHAAYTDLKKKLYLNLSLVTLNLGDHKKCSDYCDYLLEMTLSEGERAKVLYRSGKNVMGTKRYDDAVRILEDAAKISSDPGVAALLQQARGAVAREKLRRLAAYARFFQP